MFRWVLLRCTATGEAFDLFLAFINASGVFWGFIDCKSARIALRTDISAPESAPSHLQDAPQTQCVTLFALIDTEIDVLIVFSC